MPHSYNTDHTNTFIKFRLGVLPDLVTSQIPRSTLTSWKSRDHEAIRFLDDELSENEMEVHKLVHKFNRISGVVGGLVRTLKLYKSVVCDKIKKAQAKPLIGLIKSLQPKIGLKPTLKLVGVSKAQFYNWSKSACNLSAIGRCFKTHVRQLTSKEVGVIKAYMNDVHYLSWSAVSVFHQIRRDGAAFMSKSTFYKYIRALKLSRQKSSFKKSDYHQKIKATSPLSVLHMDTTVHRFVDGKKLCISVIMDNYSKAILGLKFNTAVTSGLAADNLNAVLGEYGHEGASITLVTDNGAENKGRVRALINSQSNVQHKIAQIDIIASNSMVEATNKTLKHQFLFPKATTYEQAIGLLPQIKEQFNNQPKDVLNGLTPNEVLAGTRPEQVSYTLELKKADEVRRKTNKKVVCELA